MSDAASRSQAHRRFLWFAPNAGNWTTTQMEHRVAQALAAEGHEVVMVQCDRVLKAYCQVMKPAGVEAVASASDKAAVCRDCRFNAELLSRNAQYTTVQLSEFITDEDAVWADAVAGSTSRSPWEPPEVDGRPVGRWASYTTMLHHKRESVADTDEAWAEYIADLRGALLVARAMPRLLDRFAPTHAVVYNPLYPANRVFTEYALDAGATLVNLSAGSNAPRRYETLAIHASIKSSQTVTSSKAFRESMDVPASEHEVEQVAAHLEALMSASDPWVYSSAVTRQSASDVRRQLGLEMDATVATVLVSSPDEARSSMLVDAEFFRDPVAGYASAAEFLVATLDLARSRPDVSFVFRLHPRLARNRRDPLESPDLAQIDRILSAVPPNVAINRPSDGLSLYDLVLISDACINHTSSAGLEFLSLGLPLVHFDPARAGQYPASFAQVVPRADPEAYRRQLGAALSEGLDVTRAVLAFRWLATWQLRAVVELDGAAPTPSGDAPPVSGEARVPSHARRLVARALPRRVKRDVASAMGRRQRAASFAPQPLPPQTVQRIGAMIAGLDSTSEVWEPHLLLPEGTTAETERAFVAAAVGRLLTRLNLREREGLGALRHVAED